jgi:large conductance mechanosensitive channel
VTASSLAEARKQGAVLANGNFITLTINFSIIAFCLFVVVQMIGRLRRQEAAPAEAPAPTKTEVLLQDIRDILAKK